MRRGAERCRTAGGVAVAPLRGRREMTVVGVEEPFHPLASPGERPAAAAWGSLRRVGAEAVWARRERRLELIQGVRPRNSIPGAAGPCPLPDPFTWIGGGEERSGGGCPGAPRALLRLKGWLSSRYRGTAYLRPGLGEGGGGGGYKGGCRLPAARSRRSAGGMPRLLVGFIADSRRAGQLDTAEYHSVIKYYLYCIVRQLVTLP